ncbi:Transcriptional regulator, LysR family protein [Minicystis rosea]|nr:Transcriptional regulator, LysR family protein [Minicystis rosea]
MNISALDLNLFLVFRAVLEEGTTVGAARRLSVTQSAVSNALARLRHAVGDPLFVRNGRGLVPTPRAEEMRPAITEAIRKLEGVLGDAFDPRATTRTFTIACADHHQAADVPRVAHAFAGALPRARLRVVSVDYLLSSDGLASGTIDVLLAPEGTSGQGLHATPLFREVSELLVRAEHPVLRKRATFERLAELGHIDVHITLGEPGTVNRSVSGALLDLGFDRRIAVVTPSFTTAAMIAARTDYVAWLPEHAARLFGDVLGLRALRTPLPSFDIGCSLVWHERTHADPGAVFFRDLVLRELHEAEPRRQHERPASGTRKRRRATAKRTRSPASRPR